MAEDKLPLSVPEKELSLLVTSLSRWAGILVRHQPGANALALVAHFDQTIEKVVRYELKKELKACIEQEKEQLSVGLEDYGYWRSTRGNQDYGAYVAAKTGYSREVAGYQAALGAVVLIEESLAELSGHGCSIEDFVRTLSELHRLAVEIGTQTITPRSPEPIAVAIDDLHLCMAWSGKQIHSGANIEESFNHLVSLIGSYDACRLLSARLAEKTASTYYEALGKSVTDVSILQLAGQDQRWRDFDLLVDGRPIDVKNARESFSSPDTYVEHCVPRFKLDRESGIDVSIVGVLSPYMTESKILAGEESSLILGEAHVQDIRDLYVWMRRRFGNGLNLNGLWRYGFLPGWIFEYSDSHYRNRAAAIKNIGALLQRIREQLPILLRIVPDWQIVLCADRNLITRLETTNPKRRILEDLISLRDQIGLSRPTLFVFAMGILLEAMLNDDLAEDVARTLRQLLFVNSDSKLPLGLSDTQEYISSLINILPIVQQEATRQGIRFSCFKMPHPSILRGQRQDLSWMTLLAYCGGWREVPVRARCGASPLFFGSHESCPSCGHLVCGECGFCSTACALVR